MATKPHSSKSKSAGKGTPAGRHTPRRTTKRDRLVRLLKAVAGRDIYGRRWSAGEIETKYRGDFGYATVRGPGGRRTAMAGPYGGAVVTRFPSGYRTVNYHNRPYHYYGGSIRLWTQR